MSQETARCPGCQRILHLVKGKIPMHRVPTVANATGSTPLTGSNELWCSRGQDTDG